jgi:hypothetical protein
MRLTALFALLLLLDTSPRGEEKFEIVLDATKKLKLSFVRIPAGTFTMGEAGTAHRVRITKAFWMMTTEVTQAQWQFVMGGNPSEFKGDDKPVDSVSWTEAHDFLDKLAPRRSGSTHAGRARHRRGASATTRRPSRSMHGTATRRRRTAPIPLARRRPIVGDWWICMGMSSSGWRTGWGSTGARGKTPRGPSLEPSGWCGAADGMGWRT